MDLFSLLSAATSFIVSLISIGTVVFKVGQMAERLNKLENTSIDVAKIQVKVDTVWDFLVRRAFAEAVNKGIGEMRSPMVVKQEPKEGLKEIAGELKSWYNSMKVKPSDSDLALEIERRWGKWIVENFCILHNYTQGECLAVAMSLAKGEGEGLSLP